MRDGHRGDSSREHGLPWHVVSVGRQGLRHLPAEPVRNYRDFLERRRPLGPRALARAAQRRGVPAAVGQGRAVAAVGAAHRRRRRPLRRQLRAARRGRRLRRGRADDRRRRVSAWSGWPSVRRRRRRRRHRPRHRRPASSSRCSAPPAAARRRRCGWSPASSSPTRARSCSTGATWRPTPPHKRPVNTVFQTYALFPFMTVWDNVAFGLRYQKVGKAETDARVGEALELVQMRTMRQRRPGPAVRRPAAAGRAGPRAGAQPARAAARRAARRARRQAAQGPAARARAAPARVGITFVYVTHDQEEALTMSDRLAVIARRQGRAGRRAGGGLRAPGDGVRRRLPRLGEHLRRRGASASTPARRPARARHALVAAVARRRARRGAGGGRRSGPSGSRVAAADRRTAPPGHNALPAWSTTSSTSAPATQVGVRSPTARRCWSQVAEPGRAAVRHRPSAGSRRCVRLSPTQCSRLLAATRRPDDPPSSTPEQRRRSAGASASLTRGRARRPAPSSSSRCSAKLHRDVEGDVGVDHRVLERDLDRQPVEQHAERQRESSASTSPNSPACLAVAHDAARSVSRQRPSSSTRSSRDLGVPERLRPQVEPQSPGAADVAVALRARRISRTSTREPLAEVERPRRAAGARVVEASSEKRSASMSSRSWVPK